MGHPGAVVAVGHLPLLVGADAGEGGLVGGRIVLHGDVGGHAADGRGAALVAGPDRQQAVGLQEMRRQQSSSIVIPEAGGFGGGLPGGKLKLP